MAGCETNTSWCRSASGFEDLLLCGSSHCSVPVNILTWHWQRIFCQSAWSILLFLQTRALSFFLSCLGNVQLFIPNNSILGRPRDEKLLCMCAFLCESHYHNLQPIKSLRNAALMVLITTCPTRSNKESPYGTTGAKKVG